MQIMAWLRPGDKPLSEPMLVSLLTHIYASLGLNELKTFLSTSFNHKLQIYTSSLTQKHLKILRSTSPYNQVEPTLYNQGSFCVPVDRHVLKLKTSTSLFGPLGTNFNEFSIEIYTFSFKKINAFENVIWKKGGHFVSASMCWQITMRQASVQCPYYTVLFITISYMRWQEQKLNQTSNSQDTPYLALTRKEYLLWEFWRKLTAL